MVDCVVFKNLKDKNWLSTLFVKQQHYRGEDKNNSKLDINDSPSKITWQEIPGFERCFLFTTSGSLSKYYHVMLIGQSEIMSEKQTAAKFREEKVKRSTLGTLVWMGKKDVTPFIF